MPYDKDGKYFRKPVFNENFKGLKNKKPSETTSNKPMRADEIKKERFRKEYEKLKNYKGSESYQRMMSKNKGSTGGDQTKNERLKYKKEALESEKSIRGLTYLICFLLCVAFPPLIPFAIIGFVLYGIGTVMNAYKNDK